MSIEGAPNTHPNTKIPSQHVSGVLKNLQKTSKNLINTEETTQTLAECPLEPPPQPLTMRLGAPYL